MSMEEFGYDTPFATIGGFGQIDYNEMNKGITPLFFHITEQDHKASEEAGSPKFMQIEAVRLIVAGDMNSSPTLPVDDTIRERFAPAYEHWKAKKAGQHITGTPLKEWTLVTPPILAEMNALNINSVEDLSLVSDNNITKLTDGRIWRDKALAWLKNAKDSAHVTKLAAENARLKDDVDSLKKQVSDLAAQIEGKKK